MEREGGCACGAIRFVVTGPFAGVGACHCTDCQKETGGGAGHVALARKGSLVITKGSPKFFRKRSDSGAEVTRAFCGDCGTPLWSGSERMPFTPVKLGSLDDFDDLSPQIHMFVSSAPAWHQFGEGLPKFDKMPPVPAEPR